MKEAGVREARQNRSFLIADVRKGHEIRTLDALHIALAVSGEARYFVTVDHRMSEAAALHGLRTV